MHVRLSGDAEADLDQIHAYIVLDSPAAAIRVIDDILLAAFQLEVFPLLGRPGRVDGTREMVVPRTPYFIVYTLPDAYHIDIERILHGSRQYPPSRD